MVGCRGLAYGREGNVEGCGRSGPRELAGTCEVYCSG